MPRKKTDTQEKEENKASIEENFAQLEEIIKNWKPGTVRWRNHSPAMKRG